jgi:hypothetical protein
VDCPSVNLSDLTTDGKIRATRNLAGGCKKESVGVWERGERGDCRGEPQLLGSRQEKESNLRPRVFLYREKESNLRP